VGLTVAMFLRMTFCAPEWCSTITTWRAPREAASKPKAPVPANRSRIVPWKPFPGFQPRKYGLTNAIGGRAGGRSRCGQAQRACAACNDSGHPTTLAGFW